MAFSKPHRCGTDCRTEPHSGAAAAMPCAQTNMGARQVVKYQADYIFYKAM